MTTATRYSRTSLPQARVVETVRRPGLVADLTPAGTANLFTITGAPVDVFRLFGVVTVVIGGGLAVPRLQFTPTGGGAATWICAIAAAIDGTAVNVCFTWSGALLGVLTPGVGVGHLDLTGAEAGFASPLTFTPGTIQLVNTVSALSGVIDWYISYIGLTDTALIVAA